MGVCFTKQSKLLPENAEEEQKESPAIKRRQNVRLSVMPHHRQRLEELKTNEKIAKPSDHPQQQRVVEITERVLIHGVMGGRTQKSYQDKKVQTTASGISLQSLSSIGIGVSCKKGLKPGSPNQDDFCLIIDPTFRLFCVFDGHGLFGHQISNFVKMTLPEQIIHHSKFLSDPKRSIQVGFQNTNKALIQHCRTASFNCEESGTTATIGLLIQNKLYIAHVGDSRAVLGSRKGVKHTALRITTDHKPELPKEAARIKEANGQIRRLPDDIPYRVFQKNKEGPGLSISRAIGDRVAQTIGVSFEPEISEIQLDEQSEYLVMCSDGVWEFINDQEAITTVTKIGNKCKLASEKLAYLAWNRWIQNEGDVVDDITAMVVYLPWQNTNN